MDAFELASSVRYLDDVKLKTYSPDPSLVKNIEAGLALNSLKISPEITPELYNCLAQTCNNLSLDINKVNAYVTSSPEIQAGCISFDKENCIITLTSAVINLLDFEEINFVIGHEIGHFLLSHNIEQQHSVESQEGYIKKRAQEISVDRIGLMACKDINIAVRAITKSLSGLSEKYVSFNMQGFLNQLDLEVAKNEDKGRFSSHPSFILRIKALMRFSLSEPFLMHAKEESGTSLQEIDKLIQQDLNTYIDKDLRRDINQAKEMVLFWGFSFAYVKGGSFSRENQENLAKQFGQDKTDKLIKMLSSRSSDDAVNEVKSKLLQAINNFRIIAPNTSRKELNISLMEIGKETNQESFFNEVMQLS